ncbi:MAG: GNAT family N-acetyltransferase [Pirellulales bacterium]
MATVLAPRKAATPRPAAARLQVRRARSLDEVDAWEPAWRDLQADASAPTEHFDWTRACLAAFPVGVVPHVVSVFARERLVALAPLVKKRLHGVCRLFSAGVAELNEPTDIVGCDERALLKLLRAIVCAGCPAIFERMPADSPCLPALRRAARWRAIVQTRPHAACPYIELDEHWLEPELQLDFAPRDTLAQARRAADQLGAVATEIHAPDLSELPTTLDAAFELFNQRGELFDERGAHGARQADDPQRAVFYRRYARAACEAGLLRVCFLRIGDVLAAAQLAVEQAGAFWLLRQGSDPHFAGCAPELLLTRDTIRYAAESGLARYEFLNSADEWSATWTRRRHPCVECRVYPLGMRGMAALVADCAAAWIERWRHVGQ